MLWEWLAVQLSQGYCKLSFTYGSSLLTKTRYLVGLWLLRGLFISYGYVSRSENQFFLQKKIPLHKLAQVPPRVTSSSTRSRNLRLIFIVTDTTEIQDALENGIKQPLLLKSTDQNEDHDGDEEVDESEEAIEDSRAPVNSIKAAYRLLTPSVKVLKYFPQLTKIQIFISSNILKTSYKNVFVNLLTGSVIDIFYAEVRYGSITLRIECHHDILLRLVYNLSSDFPRMSWNHCSSC